MVPGRDSVVVVPNVARCCRSPPDLSRRPVKLGRGEPHAALRNHGYLDAHHGQPARRLTNPITRCWDQPHYRRAARTDDERGTDPRLDTERLTLMSAHLIKRSSRSAHRTAGGTSLHLGMVWHEGAGRVPRRR